MPTGQVRQTKKDAECLLWKQNGIANKIGCESTAYGNFMWIFRHVNVSPVAAREILVLFASPLFSVYRMCSLNHVCWLRIAESAYITSIRTDAFNAVAQNQLIQSTGWRLVERTSLALFNIFEYFCWIFFLYSWSPMNAHKSLLSFYFFINLYFNLWLCLWAIFESARSFLRLFLFCFVRYSLILLNYGIVYLVSI